MLSNTCLFGISCLDGMVELRQLRYFLATVDEGTVSGAAVRLHVTQPGLSRQLRQLERDLGVDLFDRTAGRLRLSRSGSALLSRVREVMAAVESLRADASFLEGGGLRRLVVAAPTVTLTDVVSPFVATMEPGDPVVDVRAGDGLTIAQMLGTGADLAIGTQRPPPPFAFRRLAVLPVWAYVQKADPWSSRNVVPLRDLLERDVVGLPTTFTAREALDAAVSSIEGSLSAFVEAANGTIAQALAAAGRGVAVVSDDPRFDLVPLAVDVDGKPLSITLFAAWDSRSIAASSMERLAGRLEAWVASRYGPGPA
jgi:LysR family transcriptional regulator, benzoate and cis,cis-muconate-responsive activator of ben and cat genes